MRENIKVETEVKKELGNRKLVPEETYSSVIQRLLEDTAKRR